MRLQRHLALAASLGVVALTAGAVRAASGASTWSRISGPTQPGAQLGLVRTQDGVLHVVWNKGATPTSIFETRLSPTGSAAGTSTVATGFDGNGGLALLAMPDQTLRLFAAGATHPGSSVNGINTYTAPTHGGSWSLQTGASWGGAVANSASVIGATLAKNGQPVTAWRGTAAEGMPPSSIPPNAYIADQTGSRLATDSASGAVVIAGTTLAGKGGVAVQQILPGHGAQVAPAASVEPDGLQQRDQRPNRGPRRVRRLRGRQGRQALPLRRFGQDAGHRSVQQRDGLHRARGPALGHLGRQRQRALRHPLEPRGECLRAGAESVAPAGLGS